MCMSVCVRGVCMSVCVQYMHVCTRVCACLYMCVWCMHVCTRVCMWYLHVCARVCTEEHQVFCSTITPHSLETSISLNQELSYLSLVWLTTPDAGVSAASTPDAGVSGTPLATPGSLCGYRESEIPQAFVFAQQPFFPTH